MCMCACWLVLWFLRLSPLSVIFYGHILGDMARGLIILLNQKNVERKRMMGKGVEKKPFSKKKVGRKIKKQISKIRKRQYYFISGRDEVLHMISLFLLWLTIVLSFLLLNVFISYSMCAYVCVFLLFYVSQVYVGFTLFNLYFYF